MVATRRKRAATSPARPVTGVSALVGDAHAVVHVGCKAPRPAAAASREEGTQGVQAVQRGGQ
eukprot:scaffold30_cov416-Prasinococcus_capsulatus_cf.AAC.25